MKWVCKCKLSCLLLIAALMTMEAQTCALYNPPSPGIHCFHGDQVMGALTRSRVAWMIELYSSWCGHCQTFAPRLQELAKEIGVWSEVVKMGVIECTSSKEDQNMCGQMGVQGYPTVRFFRPNDPSPLEFKKAVVGSKSIEAVRHLIVDHIISITPPPINWPNFGTLVNGSILEEAGPKWIPTVFVFEENSSYIGKELILDFSSLKMLRIRRVSKLNIALVQHYSILEFPSVVVEFTKGHYHIVAGHSVKDARSEFREKIAGFLQSSGLQSHDKSHSRSRGRSHDKEHVPMEALKIPHSFKNRVEMGDLLSAVSYGLRAEVPLHFIISGSAFSALFNFVSLLEQGFSHVSHTGSAYVSIQKVRVQLEDRKRAGFITSKEWNRIMDTKLDVQVFPTHVTWDMCNGSLPHLRGYPCGLWMLSHTLTFLTLPTDHTPSSPLPPITTVRALTIITNFIKNFFSCEVCRQHFTGMARASTQHPLALESDGDAVLWLWEAHNAVNARLSIDGLGVDPLHPKALFPSISRCPYCYLGDGSHDPANVPPNFNNTKFASGASLLVGVAGGAESPSPQRELSRNMLRVRQLKGMEGVAYEWNTTAVFLYLWNYYSLNRTDHKSPRAQHDILLTAWPRRYGMGDNRYHRMEWRHTTDSADSASCVQLYVLCGMTLVVIIYVVWRKRQCRKILIHWLSKKYYQHTF